MECKYHNLDESKWGIAYALMQINKDIKIMISANEMQAFDDIIENAKYKEKINITDEVIDETPKIVYGAFILNTEIFDYSFGIKNEKDRKSILEKYIHNLPELKMISIDGIEDWKNIDKVAIVKSFKFINTDNDSYWQLPFAALIYTDLAIPKNRSLTLFTQFGDLDLGTNIINRHFLLACRDMDVLENLPEDYNWENYIDENKFNNAYKIADLISLEDID